MEWKITNGGAGAACRGGSTSLTLGSGATAGKAGRSM